MDDVHRVTGQELKMDESKPGKVSARYAIIAGTIGESGWIDALASRNKIDTAAIAGSWERYMIEVVNNPYLKLLGEAAKILRKEKAVAFSTKLDTKSPNPFIRHMYTADPSAHVWKDGRLYVYASHDIAPPRGCD